jgi:hypothetical protein
MKYDKSTFTTDVLLSFMVKLKQLKAAAHQEAFQPKADPRYSAIEIKIDVLLERAKKLIPVVMLAEVESFKQLIKDIYQLYEEKEESETTQKEIGNGH